MSNIFYDCDRDDFAIYYVKNKEFIPRNNCFGQTVTITVSKCGDLNWNTLYLENLFNKKNYYKISNTNNFINPTYDQEFQKEVDKVLNIIRFNLPTLKHEIKK